VSDAPRHESPMNRFRLTEQQGVPGGRSTEPGIRRGPSCDERGRCTAGAKESSSPLLAPICVHRVQQQASPNLYVKMEP
jgi:hypothetical protein